MNKALHLRKENIKMSYMVAMKNKNGIVISTESRLLKTEGVKSKIKSDDFTKVFHNKSKGFIWGMTGYYGQNENTISQIQSIFDTYSLEEARSIIKQNILAPDNFMINLFIGTKEFLYIIDIKGNEWRELVFDDTEIMNAGAHLHMENMYSISDIENNTIKELVTKSCKMVKNEIKVDKYIKSLNPHFKNSLGGDVRTISIDAKGHIKTYVNGEEDIF